MPLVFHKQGSDSPIPTTSKFLLFLKYSYAVALLLSNIPSQPQTVFRFLLLPCTLKYIFSAVYIALKLFTYVLMFQGIGGEFFSTCAS